MVLISVVNHCAIADEEVQKVIRAINRQIEEDFNPYWSMGAVLRLEGRTAGREPDPEHPIDMKGDGVIYLYDEINADALGYHDLNHRGVPFGFVFLEISDRLKESWTVTLSHEALEMVADPEVNLLVRGPHPNPDEGGREVFHWYEMCDAVQDEHYQIDGIEVSNFLLPLYFTPGEEEGRRNDFLGRRPTGATIRSFGLNPGGYVGFFDPLTGHHETFAYDSRATARMAIKNKAKGTRRALRYGVPLRLEGQSPTGKMGYGTSPPTRGDAHPHATLEGLYIETVKPAGKTPRSARKWAQGLVQARLGTDWKLSWFDCPDGKLPRSIAKLQTLPWFAESAGQVISVKEAWETVYLLESEPHIADVEPLFEIETLEWAFGDDEEASTATLRASGGGDTDRPGEKCREWSLKQLNVLDAWEYFKRKHPHGLPGQGIRIGHPDTGYTRNPEIWAANSQMSRVSLRGAYDFYEKDADPTDPLTQGNKGHGTGVASVIVSSRYEQDPNDIDNQVSGIAPGAKIVPYRVQPSVVLFSMKNLARSIIAAVDNDCHVISISMGGPFGSRKLKKAASYARQRGVIVIAAAGNVWPFVVAPAKCDDVIAIAATNITKGVWRHSARGSKVDVSAPGENVWRSKSKIASGALKPQPGKGSGTSYAAAGTAGVAALWLSYHGRDTLITQYGKEGMVDLFHHLLRKSTHTPPSWNKAKHGTGIVDALALLQAPLPTVVPPRFSRAFAETISRPDLGTIEHYFGDLSAEAVWNALGSLFNGEGAPLSQTLADIGDEIVFYLATMPDIRRELELLARTAIRGRTASSSEVLRSRRVLGRQFVQAGISERFKDLLLVGAK